MKGTLLIHFDSMVYEPCVEKRAQPTRANSGNTYDPIAEVSAFGQPSWLAGLGRQAITDVTPQHKHRNKTAAHQGRRQAQQHRTAQLVDDLPAKERAQGNN